jgi:hypothetical protein
MQNGLSLDRIKNDKDYCKKNCRWVTMKEQSVNKRTTKMITFNGKTQCVSYWANELNIPYLTLWRRLYKYNYSIKEYEN